VRSSLSSVSSFLDITPSFQKWYLRRGKKPRFFPPPEPPVTLVRLFVSFLGSTVTGVLLAKLAEFSFPSKAVFFVLVFPPACVTPPFRVLIRPFQVGIVFVFHPVLASMNSSVFFFLFRCNAQKVFFFFLILWPASPLATPPAPLKTLSFFKFVFSFRPLFPSFTAARRLPFFFFA